MARQNGVCRHCKAAWPGVQEALEEKAKNLKQKLLASRLSQQARARASAFAPAVESMPKPDRDNPYTNWNECEPAVGFVRGNVSFGGSSSSSDNYTLPHHMRQRSRSRSSASNLVGTCPICFERPKNHCFVPCGPQGVLAVRVELSSDVPTMPRKLHPNYQGVGLMSGEQGRKCLHVTHILCIRPLLDPSR